MKRLPHLIAAAVLILPLAAAAAEAININTADKQRLTELDGVGDARAQAIVDYREENGRFGSVDELTDVSGIGPATLSDNRERLSVGGGD